MSRFPSSSFRGVALFWPPLCAMLVVAEGLGLGVELMKKVESVYGTEARSGVEAGMGKLITWLGLPPPVP